MGDFHEKRFGEATTLKIEIFRGYIREWLPVFLSSTTFREVHIYDFFCGPGTDAQGNPGSPMTIMSEIEQYIADDKSRRSSERPIYLHFNDKDADKVNALRSRIGHKMESSRCSIEFSAMDFADAFDSALPSLKSAGTANLLILDQYGIKEVNERIFRKIVACPATDVLFFLSSSNIRRFVSEGPIQKYFDLSREELSDIPAKQIHRHICNEYYRKLIPPGCRYHVAPFSIQKDKSPNIYGIIFGSGNLLGLEKFLRVCWNKDQVTGEANFDIDDDIPRYGQGALFEEHGSIKKQDWFEKELSEYIRECSPDNRMLFEFILECGFLPKHANEILRKLQSDGVLDVRNLEDQSFARRGAFYLSWKDHKKSAQVVFRLIGD